MPLLILDRQFHLISKLAIGPVHLGDAEKTIESLEQTSRWLVASQRQQQQETPEESGPPRCATTLEICLECEFSSLACLARLSDWIAQRVGFHDRHRAVALSDRPVAQTRGRNAVRFPAPRLIACHGT